MTINKKIDIMIKRFLICFVIITLFLDFAVSASSVSDNDGSAFITKAEFDSLKNTFQSQIDSFNSGIDNKIDSAIASYLAGIIVSTKTTRSLLLTDDEGYWFYGKRPEQTYAVPGIHYMFSMHGAGHNGTSSWNQYGSSYGCTLIAKSSPVAMTKNIVSLAEGEEKYYKTYTKNKWLWEGVNNTWKENIQFAAQSYNSYSDIPNAETMRGMSVYKAYDFSVTNGYHADVSNLWKTFTATELYYLYSTSSKQDKTGTLRNGFLDWSANYDSASTKKKIVCSIKSCDWNAVCSTLTNTWNTDTEQTLFGGAIETGSSSTYDGSMVKMRFGRNIPVADENTWTTTGTEKVMIEGHANPGTMSGSVSSKDIDGTASSKKIPSVCSLGYIPSKELYMFVTKKSFGDNSIENIKLTDGIPLFYAKNATEVKLKFKVNSVTGGTGSGVSSTDEVDIALAYGKFSDSGYTASDGYVDSTDTTKKSSTIKWFTTSSKTKDINLTMTENSWVYLKAKPHSLTQAQAENKLDWNINFSTAGDYGKVTCAENK